MQCLEGRIPAKLMLDQLKAALCALPKTAVMPQLAFILIGEEGASLTYVQRKEAVAKELGFLSQVIRLKENVTEFSLLEKIKKLNEDPRVHGVLVQAPLPSHLSSQTIFNAISPIKDVDGFHAENLGHLCQGDVSGLVSCTPAGIAELLRYYKIPTQGRHVVIVGRSVIVGRPAALLFLEKTWNATVTVCHSASLNLEQITKSADILIVATGRPQWINETHIRPSAVLIDVGISRLPDAGAPRGYSLVGDIDAKRVQGLAHALTPVPGGVGPLTVAQLMVNTFKAYQKQIFQKH